MKINYKILNKDVRKCLLVGFSDEGCCFESLDEWIKHELTIILDSFGIIVSNLDKIVIEMYCEECWCLELYYKNNEHETILY